ncbi:MAG: hypothetical protein FWB76_02445 [Oscillospiraceae bacterium]|nr:hypothetical protein [Oscillospiraceae bacterium]
MCYILTGYVQEQYVNEAFRSVCDKYQLMRCHAKEDWLSLAPKPKMVLLGNGGHCDCGTAIGSGKLDSHDELRGYINFWKDLRELGVPSFTLFKHWDDGKPIPPPPVKKINLDYVDETFLANMKEDVLYTIYMTRWN